MNDTVIRYASNAAQHPEASLILGVYASGVALVVLILLGFKGEGPLGRKGEVIGS